MFTPPTITLTQGSDTYTLRCDPTRTDPGARCWATHATSDQPGGCQAWWWSTPSELSQWLKGRGLLDQWNAQYMPAYRAYRESLPA